MADGTKIEWAEATVNYINGCSLESPGCTNCYAMRLAGTRLKHHPSREGLTQDTKAGPVWNGKVRAWPPALEQVLGWKRGRAIFWNAHGDLFHPDVSDEDIDRQFAVMALTPHHRHMVLTKRAARMRAYCDRITSASGAGAVADAAIALGATVGRSSDILLQLAEYSYLSNVWLGVSVEDQTRADERIPDLLATPAAVRFLSCEPLLGPVNLREVCNGHYFQNPLTGRRYHDQPEGVPFASDHGGATIDWVIVGGESGPGSRPMHPDWARALRDQCAAAGVAFHFKQWGEFHPSDAAGHPADCKADHIMAFRADDTQEWRPTEALGWGQRDGWQGMCRIGKKQAGRVLDGVTHDGVPA